MLSNHTIREIRWLYDHLFHSLQHASCISTGTLAEIFSIFLLKRSNRKYMQQRIVKLHWTIFDLHWGTLGNWNSYSIEVYMMKKRKKKKKYIWWHEVPFHNCSEGTLNSVFQFISSILYLGFPDSSVGKESACNAGDPNSIPGSGRSTGEGISYPLQYSLASLVAQLVNNLSAIRQTCVLSLG